jgi:aminoglycoside phosphotransferase
MDLRLDDGTTITGLSRPPQGMRHRVLFGVEAASGREVAVKIELLSGALEPERRALEWLGADRGADGAVAPRLLAAGTVASGEDRGAACLLTERIVGEAPRSPDAWERLGRALARLAALPGAGSGLVIYDHVEFLARHDRRVADLVAALGGDLGARLPAVPPSYAGSPLVLTHGDPGPGNFLDDGAAGTLIDWEDAQVAPRGLDLGRAAFIALQGSGPEGYVGEDREARARAVVAGFRAEGSASRLVGGRVVAGRGRAFDAEELRWWLAVAGVQFAHRRLERAGEPGVLPWRDAVAVLDRVPAAGIAGWSPGPV